MKPKRAVDLKENHKSTCRQSILGCDVARNSWGGPRCLWRHASFYCSLSCYLYCAVSILLPNNRIGWRYVLRFCWLLASRLWSLFDYEIRKINRFDLVCCWSKVMSNQPNQTTLSTRYWNADASTHKHRQHHYCHYEQNNGRYQNWIANLI